MPAILTRHLPILLGIACISLTSTAWSATCNKPNVKGYNTPRKLDQKIAANKIE